MTDPFVPTHVVPAAGAPVWAEPDPAAPQHSRLAPSTPVRLIEQRADGWARVAFSNGWEGWLDGRVLITAPAPVAATAATAASRGTGRAVAEVLEPIVTTQLTLIGAAAAVIGGFLPWLSSGGFDVSAWDLSMVALLRGEGPASGPDVGLVLLLVALVALPQVTKQPLPALAVLALGGLACNSALLLWLQNREHDSPADLGVGLFVTFAGGAAILADVYVVNRRAQAPT